MARAFLLKLPYGEHFNTVAGLEMTSFCAMAGLGDDLTPGDMPSNPITLAVSGRGTCTSVEAEKRLKSLAVTGELCPMELSFVTGERYQAKFMIMVMDFLGDIHGEATYHISIESAGEIKPL